LFRPFSAAPNLFSLCASHPHKNSRHRCTEVGSKLPRFAQASICQPIPFGAVFPKDDDIALPPQFLYQFVYARNGNPSRRTQPIDDFRAADGIVSAQHLLSIEQEQNCDIWIGRPDRQRDDTAILAHDLVELDLNDGRAGFWRWKDRLRFRSKAGRRWGRTLVPHVRNKLAERLELLVYYLRIAFRLEFVLPNLELESVRFCHDFTPNLATHL